MSHRHHHHHHHHHHHGDEWVPSAGGDVPEDAVIGGEDGGDDDQYYVGRAYHEGDLVPGKVHPCHGTCYVSWGGGEHKKYSYEVLVTGSSSYEWVSACHGHIPSGAVEGGRTRDGERLFVARAEHDGNLVCGKLHPSHKTCYIPYAGEEHRYDEYEVLVKE